MTYNKLLPVLATVMLLQGCVAAAIVGVATGVDMAKDNRSLGNQIDDQKIELTAHSQLSTLEGIDKQTNIQVISVNGQVLIVGQAPNQHVIDKIVRTIGNINGVEQVNNQLRILDTLTVQEKTKDLWLTSKIKTKLISEENLNSSSIKVVTENAEVFLMGVVSKQDANKAVEITRNINGVAKVFKLFEYLD